MTVWIAQCLCPRRHTILAASGEADDKEAAERTVVAPLREHVAKLLGAREINPWCGLCHAASASWSYEIGRSRHQTMQEALPELKATEDAQIATGAMFGELLGTPTRH